MSDRSAAETQAHDGAANRRLLLRMLGLAWRYRRGCMVVFVQQAVLVLVSLFELGLTGLGIDYIRSQAGEGEIRWPLGLAPPGAWAPLSVVAVMAGGILGLALTHAVVKYASALSLARLVQQIVTRLRCDVYDKLQRLNFRFFDSHQSGSIINRVAGDVQAVRAFVDGVLIQALVVVLSLLAYLIYMLSVHVPLTLACLATTPLLWISAIRFSRAVRPQYVENSQMHDDLTLALAENFQGVQVIKGFARQTQEIANFQRLNAKVRDHKCKIFWRISIFQPGTGFLTQLNMMVLLGYGGYLVVRGELLLGGGLFVFANLLSQFANQIAQVTAITNSIQTSLTGAERVFEILDMPVEIASPPNAVRLDGAKGAVRFEGVTFAYTPGNPVLHDVSFDIEPGQQVAIVGATGAGKSSLLSLIPRFYDPAAGRVLIDGLDVRTLDLKTLRRSIGLVFQESFLFSNTVAANIAFGAPDATREDIVRAAKIAAAEEFIDRLPQGYDTVIGEYGSNLSGGQRQRLAIARAVLLQPPILLLDDAFAAVDPETEHEIALAVRQASRGRTTFIVANRKSTIRRADLVIVMDQGRVIQVAPPHEVLGDAQTPLTFALNAGDKAELPALGHEQAA